MTDFSTWDRSTLERFANEVYLQWQRAQEEVEQLRLENRNLFEEWKKEVKNNG